MLAKLAKNHKLLMCIIAAFAAVLALVAAGCGKSTESTDTAAPNVSEKAAALNGAGSTFDQPLFTQMFSEYSKIHPKVTVNYQGVGSGAGIKQLSDQTVDFGATDAPMKPEELSAAKGGAILHIPVTLGAVAVTYNVPNVEKGLKLTPQVVADIYLGKITKWNDSQIAAANKGVNLPDLAINTAHRSDGSGTTSIFTEYLSAVSSDWSSKVGNGKTVNWPNGVGGKGNAGVAAAIQQTPGTVGYVELAYAKQNDMTFAAIKNKAGKWAEPSTAGASVAAGGATIPDNLCASIVNADGDKAYPISGFSWVIVYQKQTDKDKGEAVVKLLNWMVNDGQQYSEPLDYAKLPASLVNRIDAVLKTITY
ncbi:MAG: phosphate ABC transporter substrate-binding protein PstS [Chloroflexi bacterium]|nr:phosphate ABC transporter substrate-binding protein PstS [Chloroflexota bacterium]